MKSNPTKQRRTDYTQSTDILYIYYTRGYHMRNLIREYGIIWRTLVSKIINASMVLCLLP